MSLGERIVREAADAIIAADTSGKITLWNAGAERLFGYPEAEAVAQSLDMIIPEAQRKRHWDGYHHVMQTGETRYGTRVLRVPGVRNLQNQAVSRVRKAHHLTPFVDRR